MVKRSYSVNFRVDKCPIAKNGVIVREAYSIKRLWILEENTLYPDQNSAYIAKTLLNIQHRQLGHAMMCSIKKLSDLSMVTGIKMLDNADIDEESYCVLCLKEKTT